MARAGRTRHDKLWGGRFSKEVAPEALDFHSSISFDRRLYRQDIEGSVAHARMLGRSGIISHEEARVICDGLSQILRELEAGELDLSEEAGWEDVHTAVESLLVARIGEPGRKLHTARSRNDQVAADLRLFLKEELLLTHQALRRLQAAFLGLAERHIDAVMPGYTHLQRAQPVLFAHHMLAYFYMLERDRERLRGCYERTDACPLGSGALAGVSFGTDPEYVASQLGFSKVADNSLDAVSDRDFVIEFIGAAALIMVHLSRLGEELVLWSSQEFGFVEIDEAYATGSSIMPQKRNPDVAELVRAKSGRVFGHLVGALTMMKALPLSYNRDLQEDKQALFDVVDTLKACLSVLEPLLATLKINEERMALAASEGFANATDLADYLVTKGVPFRDAHRLAGEAVKLCILRGTRLEELPLSEFKQFSPVIEEDIYERLKLWSCIVARSSGPGTALDTVKASLARARALVKRET